MTCHIGMGSKMEKMEKYGNFNGICLGGGGGGRRSRMSLTFFCKNHLESSLTVKTFFAHSLVLILYAYTGVHFSFDVLSS